MIDEIFEMIMKEARSRPGDDLNLKACGVLLELRTRIVSACSTERKAVLDSHLKDSEDL